MIVFGFLIKWFGCDRTKEQNIAEEKLMLSRIKYRSGDMIYLKPDSGRAVIEEVYTWQMKTLGDTIPTYQIRNYNGNKQEIKQTLIFCAIKDSIIPQ